MQLEERIDDFGNTYLYQTPNKGNILYSEYDGHRRYFPSANLSDEKYAYPECPIPDEMKEFIEPNPVEEVIKELVEEVIKEPVVIGEPVVDEETLSLVDAEDFDNSNDIKFIYDGKEKVFTGSPTAYAKSVLKSLGIANYIVYVDGELYNLTGKRAQDLHGLVLTSQNE